MSFTTVTRRGFLRKALGAVSGTWLALLGAGGLLTAPRQAHAALKSLDADQAKTLLSLVRTLFPHDKLGDEYYAAAVNGIDADMAGSADLARGIQVGLASLDQPGGARFADASPAERASAVRAIQDGPFINDVKSKTVVYFYNNPAVWPKFGYQGSSWEQGGYINRGFGDIDWL